MICIFVILLSGWCRTRMRSFATDVKCFYIHYLAVEVYNYVELEIKFKLLDFFLLDSTLS